VATKTIKVSDLTGQEIQGEENVALLVVQRHPAIADPVRLEVNPGELAGKLPEERETVVLTYYPADAEEGIDAREYYLTPEEFNNLSTDFDMETVLSDALREQQEREGRRRGRGRRRQARGAAEKRERIDYATPDHAGKPHRGRITGAEKAIIQREYERDQLATKNEQLEREGLRTIDPSDPEMIERYGLTG
jgi:hypothetical protein